MLELRPADSGGLQIDREGDTRLGEKDFFARQTPRSGWRLVGQGPVRNTIGSNYMGQTRLLAGYFDNVTYGLPTTQEERDTLAELDASL